MKSAKIVTIPNKVLSAPAKPVFLVDKKIKDLVDTMKLTLIQTINPKGVGLAAVQIGIPLRIFIIRPTESAKISVFINPRITEKSKEMGEIDRPKSDKKSAKNDKKLEGCLSIPAIWGHLQRHTRVRLSYLDEKGEKHDEQFIGFIATIIQHEVDHLNGILFPQRVLEQNEKLYEIEKDKEGHEKLIEVEI